MKKRLAIMLPIIVILAVLTCVYADSINITNTARRFVEAKSKEEMLSCLTNKARANMEHMSFGKREEGHSLSFGKPSIHGDNASVQVKDSKDDSNSNVLLRREDRQWRIYAIELDRMLPGSSAHKTITLNFEEPNKALGELMGLALESALTSTVDSLKGMADSLGVGLAKALKPAK